MTSQSIAGVPSSSSGPTFAKTSSWYSSSQSSSPFVMRLMSMRFFCIGIIVSFPNFKNLLLSVRLFLDGGSYDEPIMTATAGPDAPHVQAAWREVESLNLQKRSRGDECGDGLVPKFSSVLVPTSPLSDDVADRTELVDDDSKEAHDGIGSSSAHAHAAHGLFCTVARYLPRVKESPYGPPSFKIKKKMI